MEEIVLEARIIDESTATSRPYRHTLGLDKALAEMNIMQVRSMTRK
jgi:hypothetical protein